MSSSPQTSEASAGDELRAIDLPTSRTRLCDPPAELAALRASRPLCPLRYPDGHTGWLITSQSLARSLLTDPRFRIGPPARLPSGDSGRLGDILEVMRTSGASRCNLLELNPPVHTRYRRLLAPAFSVRGVEKYRSRAELIVEDVLDDMERAGSPIDLVRQFATPIATRTQCAVLGVPEHEGNRFLDFVGIAFAAESSADDVRAAFGDLCDWLRPSIERKRRRLEDDVLSFIVEQDELNRHEIFSLAFVVFASGVDATVQALALGAFALLSYPDQLGTLLDDPSRIRTAVEELLRYTSVQPVAFTRTAVQDVAIEGCLVEEGQSVSVSFAAANRDPARFDRPDALDFDQITTGHLAFGQGVHMCLGQHLARLELEIAFAKLLDRFPELRVAVTEDEIVCLAGGAEMLHGVRELAVAFAAD